MSEIPQLQAPHDQEEGQLLEIEANDLLSNRLDDTKRKESGSRIKDYTGERLFKEAPRRYRLIASMLAEHVSKNQICRACLCDIRSVNSVERREAETVPSVKAKLVRGFGALARMTLDRLQEEVPTMNQAQLAVTAGIATDKFSVLTGDATSRIEVQISQGPNVFDRMAQLHQSIEKAISAKVIDITPQISEG